MLIYLLKDLTEWRFDPIQSLFCWYICLKVYLIDIYMCVIEIFAEIFGDIFVRANVWSNPRGQCFWFWKESKIIRHQHISPDIARHHQTMPDITSQRGGCFCTARTDLMGVAVLILRKKTGSVLGDWLLRTTLTFCSLPKNNHKGFAAVCDLWQ